MLALVLVDPLHLDVEEAVGVAHHPGPGLHHRREVRLVGALDLAPLGAERGVLRQRLQAPQLVEVLRPAVPDRPRDEGGEARVREGEEAPRRHPVRHVHELLRPQLVEVAEHVRLQELRVEGGHPVDAVAPHAREVGHPHGAAAGLVDQAEPGGAPAVARVALAHLVQEPAVDLVDDLEVAGEDGAEHLDRPLLEGLGEEGVVRVGEGVPGDLPGRLPAHPVDVHEEAHELGHPERGVGVVELHRELLVEAGEVAPPLAVDPDHVLERARHEEVLLLEAQLLAPDPLVVRVEDLGDVLGVHLLVHRPPVVPQVEGLEVEGVDGLRLPQAQQVGGAVPVAEDRRVVGDPAHDPLRQPADGVPALLVGPRLGVAAEAHAHGDLRARDLPGVPEGQPLVRLLDLPAVVDELVEDAELVADAVAERRDLQRGERVHVAGGQTPEAPVAEARLLLLGEDLVEVVAELGHGLPGLVLEAEVQQGVPEVGPEQELGGEVADGAARLLVVGLARRHPPVHHPPARDERQGDVEVVAGRPSGEPPERPEERLPELLLHGVDGRPVGHEPSASRLRTNRIAPSGRR